MKIDFWNKTQICTLLSPAPRYQVHQNFTKILGVFLHVPAFPADPQWFGVTFLSETFLSRYGYGSIGIKTAPHDLPFNYKLYRIEALTVSAYKSLSKFSTF